MAGDLWSLLIADPTAYDHGAMGQKLVQLGSSIPRPTFGDLAVESTPGLIGTEFPLQWIDVAGLLDNKNSRFLVFSLLSVLIGTVFAAYATALIAHRCEERMRGDLTEFRQVTAAAKRPRPLA